MQNPLYQFKNVKMQKGSQSILEIDAFEIHRGTFYLIDGKPGSGKSTFINLLSQKNSLSEGELQYEGADIHNSNSADYKDSIAVVPQEYKHGLFGSPKVRDYMLKTVSSYSHMKNNAEAKVNDFITKFALESLADTSLKSLTPGQLRQVLLATAIACDTKILFIDEIEQHLSKWGVGNLSKLLKQKFSRDGVTIIASTMQPDLFTNTASISIGLEDGKINRVRSLLKQRNQSRKNIGGNRRSAPSPKRTIPNQNNNSNRRGQRNDSGDSTHNGIGREPAPSRRAPRREKPQRKQQQNTESKG